MTVRGVKAVEKTQQLESVLQELGSQLPGLEIRDHWEADLCAVGIVPSSRPSLLIYLSCYGRPPGHICYSIEEGHAEIEAAEDATVSRLIAAIRSRLGR